MISVLTLIILDGWGIAPPSRGNAISQAHPKTFQRLWKQYPHAELSASGTAVGLPPRQNGNSEAGHMNIGAGRIVEQDAVRINRMIRDGRFFKNPALLDAIRHVQRRKTRLHFMGLLTGYQSGHAFPLHLQALVALAREHGEIPTYLHLFTDGRDTTKYSAIGLLGKLEPLLDTHQHIATIVGRFWAMDRAKRWRRTEAAYNALVLGKGAIAKSSEQALMAAYARGESDEFIRPTIIGATAGERSESRIQSGDAVIFFNLRSDRARQMAKPFVQDQFATRNPGCFRRAKRCTKLIFVALTEFGPDLPNILTAFPSITIPETLPMALAGLRQLYLAEGEKYAHVTYFFNGGYANPVAGEDRVMLKSSNVKSFDARPSMETPRLASTILKALKAKRYDVLVANFANADMVGHTGSLKAGEKAVRTIDAALKKISAAILRSKGVLVLTADHGNIEEMEDPTSGERYTEHTGNPVPFILVGKNVPKLKAKGLLADIAPTILALLGRKKPATMTGHSLFRS